jgi:hypothetical protein
LNILPLLLALALPAKADKSALSFFLPGDLGCEWRMVSLPSMNETMVLRTQQCPEKVVFLGDQAIIGTGHELWIGDWRQRKMEKTDPPLPLPARGRLDKVGFDDQGRPIVIVSDPLPKRTESADAPGLKEDATHLSIVFALEGKDWKPLLRERTAFGYPHIGIEGLAKKVDWSGVTLADRIAAMGPRAKPQKIVVRKTRAYVENLTGAAERVYLMPADATAELKRELLTPGPAPTYYAVLPLQAPYRYIVARVEPNPVRYELPVFYVDVDQDRFLEKVDWHPQLTPGFAMDVRDGFLLTSDRFGSRWPTLFKGSPHWRGAVYEQPSAQGAIFLP